MDAMHEKHTTSSCLRNSHAGQSGQAIVLIALMMVGLIGMTGLALDGGSLLLLQRRAQKVADVAAMSAALARCDGQNENTVHTRAEEVAAANEVAADALDISYLNATDTEVIVRLPKAPYFIQIVYNGPMTAQGRSVVRCTVDEAGGESPYAEYVLFATSEICEDTLHTQGNTMTYGGTLRSNKVLFMDSMSGGSGGTASVMVTGTANYVTQAVGNRAPIWADGNRLAGYYSMDIAGFGVPHIDDKDDDSDGGLLRGAVQPAPLLYEIDDFSPAVDGVRPEGSIWASIPANRRHYLEPLPDGARYHWPGMPNCVNTCKMLPTSNGQLQGLYFIEGDLLVTDGNGVQMNNLSSEGVTFVATGRIDFNGGPIALKPFYNNLTMMSGFGASSGYQSYDVGDSITTGGNCGGGQSSTSNAINLPMQQGGVIFGTEEDPGLLYAPWGKVHFGTGHVGPTYGQVIAYTILSAHNSSSIYYGPAAGGGTGVPDPPMVHFVE